MLDEGLVTSTQPRRPQRFLTPGARGRRPSRPPRRHSPQRELLAFLLMAVLALVAVSAGTVVLSERIARETALEEAERTAVQLASRLVAPVLRDIDAGVPGRDEELARRIAYRAADGSVNSVLVWAENGEVLFSNAPGLDGAVIEPTPELRAAFDGRIVATVDEEPEAEYIAATGEGGVAQGPMLEVYVPVEVRGRTLVVETYFGYDVIARQAAVLRGEIIPLAVGSLLLLQLVQIPIAVSLVRRVRRHEEERADLLARSFTASERERRTIAGDVHDGPVQDLAGVSYALSALRSSVPENSQGTVDRLVLTVRDAVRSLRRLIVDLYPPDLSGPGLTLALEDLAGPLRERGFEVAVEAESIPELPPDVAAVLYRTAKEALANAARHSYAARLWLRLEPVERNGERAVRIEISDDGVGFGEEIGEPGGDGHFGLRLLRDRVEDLGGVAVLGERPGGGASINVVIPVRHRR